MVMMSMSCPEISVVVPIYNEGDNLLELCRRLKSVLEDDMQVIYEIVFVDDGSNDNSNKILKQLYESKTDNHIKVVTFTRNFGHHIAITAGIDYAQGSAVVLMDGDLQDPPEQIPKLYKKFREGYDIVYALRKTRKDPVLKKLFSRLFYNLFRLLAKIEIPPDTGIFRIMSRRSIDALRTCREKARFVTALMSWSGFSHIGVYTERDARYAGKTKYSFLKSTMLAFDGITSFSYFPLRVATYLGTIVVVLSIVTAIYMATKKVLLGFPISGYASLSTAVIFLGGVQLLIMGIVGEYIGRIYTEVQNRPMYIVGNTIGFNEKEERNA